MIDWGITRVGRLFKELDVPLSVVLNAEFPSTHASVWKEFRAAQPNAPIVAHGMNNSNHILPLGRGPAEQKANIRRTLDLIAGTTGVKPTGWSTPSVYSNGDTAKCLELASHRYVAAHQRRPLLTNAGSGIEAHTGGAPRRDLRDIRSNSIRQVL
jgi:peptidoglycan/xylan/chitin deacetylase (PgdA/CDA1 family)